MWWMAVWLGCPAVDTETQRERTDTPTVTAPTEVTNGTVTIEVVPNPGNPLSATARLESTAATTVHVAYGTGATLDRRTPDVMLPADTLVEVPVLGLYGAQWQIAVVVDGTEGSRWTVTTERPDTLRDLPVTAPGAPFDDDEAICFARESESPNYSCVDRQGRPTLFVDLPFNAMFVRPLSDGTFLAHPDGGDAVWQFDVRGDGLRTIGLDDLEGSLTYRHGWIDEHESIEITEGPWAGHWALMTATEGEDRISQGILVFDPDTREVVWDWSALGTPEDDASIDESQLPFDRWGVIEHGDDWLHANAMLHGVDDDGDFFWMSLRHQDWIIEIRAPSGEISWRLGRDGDFTLVDRPERDWFFHQHAPEWKRNADGTFAVWVFDNGNGRPGGGDPYSRAVELTIDREARTAEITAEITPDYFSPAAGDADRMPNDDGVLVTKAINGAAIEEYGRDGTLRWSQSVSGEGEVYRAEFYRSLYDRTWTFDTGW